MFHIWLKHSFSFKAASQNTSTNDSWPAACLLDPSPTTSTITQGELFNTSTTPLDETSTANTSTNLSGIAIFGAVVGSVLVILVSMTLVAMLCVFTVLAKRRTVTLTQHSTSDSTDQQLQLKEQGLTSTNVRESVSRYIHYRHTHTIYSHVWL